MCARLYGCTFSFGIDVNSGESVKVRTVVRLVVIYVCVSVGKVIEEIILRCVRSALTK